MPSAAGSPIVRSLRVVPVAGYDSMLLNLSGAHAPCFTRNIVIVTDSRGATGIGEVPGGEAIRQTLEDASPLVVDSAIGGYRGTVRRVREAFGGRDAGGRGLQTYDERIAVHAAAGIECALLDLLGQFLDQPMAELLAGGRVRSLVPVLGYLFFVGDGASTGLGYRGPPAGSDGWYRVRDLQALDGKAIVRQAQAAEERYGFTDFKLKGGVLSGEAETAVVADLASAFPRARIAIDPNGAWSVAEAIRLLTPLRELLAYAEDPCGAEPGYSGRHAMGAFRRTTGIPTATNMVATDWPSLIEAIQLEAIDIPLADPHFWTIEGAIEVARLCERWNMTWGSHSNNHFDISLAMFTHVGAAAPGRITPLDTHWIWQDGAALTRDPPVIANGHVRLPDRPGLGVELDDDALERASALYRSLPSGARNDAAAMQHLIPGWRFDPKRPALVR